MEELKSVDYSIGYVKAMNDVINYLKEATEFDGVNVNNSFINPIELIDFIQVKSREQFKLKIV